MAAAVTAAAETQSPVPTVLSKYVSTLEITGPRGRGEAEEAAE